MRLRAMVAVFVLLSGSAAANCQVLLTDTHIDIGLGYATGSGWDLHIADDTNGVEYGVFGAPGASDWAVITLLNHNVAPRPTGAAFNFIGVPSGAPIFRVTEAPSPFGLLLGIGTEDNAPGTFGTYFESDPRVNASGEWVRLRLKSFTGPGQVSLWASDIGGPIVYWATSDGIAATDSAFIVNGSHTDFAWAFTEAGDYTLTAEASAFLGPGATNPTLSGDVIYNFRAIPEPSSLFLAGLIAVPALLRARRRRSTIITR